MVGAIIGAAVSAGSALANWLSSKSRNDQLRERLQGEEAAAKSQEITDRYGNWRYSGANQYFNRAADEVKDYVRQARGARRATGAQNTGAEEMAGKTLAQAAGQATAQREAEGLQLAAQDRARYQALKDREFAVDQSQSAATTQALGQAAQAGASIASNLDNSDSTSGKTNAAKTTQITPEQVTKNQATMNDFAAKQAVQSLSTPAWKQSTGPNMVDYYNNLSEQQLQSAFTPKKYPGQGGL